MLEIPRARAFLVIATEIYGSGFQVILLTLIKGSVKYVGVVSTPSRSEPLSFFEK